MAWADPILRKKDQIRGSFNYLLNLTQEIWFIFSIVYTFAARCLY